MANSRLNAVQFLVALLSLTLLGGGLTVLFMRGSNQAAVQPSLTLGSDPYYGLAMAEKPGEDAALLGVEWYYDWGPSPKFNNVKAQYVPMLWDGLPDQLIPADYSGWILVFNEPNIDIQANLTPKEAARRLALVKSSYPKARLLCCGLSVFAGDWLTEFIKTTTVWPDAWHVHAYIEGYVTPEKAQALLLEMHAITAGEYWISEYNSVAGSLAEFQAMTEWFKSQPWIKRTAPYTNRQEQGAWYDMGPNVELVNDQAELTEIGKYYQQVIQNSKH